jgi:energy-converting hydrogenase A subunit R
MDYDEIGDIIGYEGRQFITDGEGPVTKNDNAFEISCHLIEDGDRLFSLVSKYDDVLADIVRKPRYKAGDTLRLILPFLKAYGATDRSMIEFSRKNILLVPGAEKTMRFVNELMPAFIVSTSYEHYVNAVCETIGFPFENAYCTTLRIDSARISDWERDVLHNYAREISRLPMIEIPNRAFSLDDFDDQSMQTIERLDQIFWEEMTDLSTYQLILEVNPVGGEEKANSILEIQRSTGIGLESTMYLGDSITDVQALQLVRDGGGVAVSFNGNAYAIREAEVCVISPNTVVTSVLAETFSTAGREGIMNLVENWEVEFLRRSGYVHDYLIKELERVFPDKLPTLERISFNNIDRLTKESSAFRKTVRGSEIGSLG